MKYIYNNKNDCITDLLQTCRMIKKFNKEKFSVKFRIRKEIWTFHIYYRDNKISTKCLFEIENNYNNKTFYPFTTWGDYGTRWDSELKNFCEREFLKDN